MSVFSSVWQCRIDGVSRFHKVGQKVGHFRVDSKDAIASKKFKDMR